MNGFIKMHRSNDTELLHKYPATNHLMSVIAYRARRTDHPFNGLKAGQAYVGDYKDIGLTERQYRTAKARLEKCGLCVFKGTNKGTIATITNTKVYDINENMKDGQETDKRRTRDGQKTTNKECKNERMEEIDEMFDIFWNAGMRKTNKKPAYKKFISLAQKKNGVLQSWTQELVDDIRERIASGQLGFDQMHPSTYLNGERWNDEKNNPQNQTDQGDFLI
jgi:hypothetical protein